MFYQFQWFSLNHIQKIGSKQALICISRRLIREDVWQETGYTYSPQPSVRIAKFHLMAAIATELCEGALQSVEIS